MERAGGNTVTFTSKSTFQNFTKENIHQIRNIIMQHEGLFKEQVQALHKLYSVQKLAMEELRKLFHFHNVSQNQHYNPVLEGKSSDCESDSPATHIQSPCACNELTGSKAENTFLKTLERKSLSNSQNKLTKRIDLERLPEEYMNEADYQSVENGLKADPLQDFQQKNLPSGCPDSAIRQSKTTIDFIPQKLSQSPQLKTPKQVADGITILDTSSQDSVKSIPILGVSVQLPLVCRFIKEVPDNLMGHDLASPGNNSLSEIYGADCEPVEGGQVQGSPSFSERHYIKPSPSFSDLNNLIAIELHTNAPEEITSIRVNSENVAKGELNQKESFRYENEDSEKQSISEETYESIAAKILLSLASSRSVGDDKLQCFQTQVEKVPIASSGDSSTHRKRMNRSARTGGVNHKNNVKADLVKFTKIVHRK